MGGKPPTCPEPIYEQGLWTRPSPCGRKAVGEHGFCGIHSPEAKAKREAKSRARYEADRAAEEKKHRKLRTFDALLAAAKDFASLYAQGFARDDIAVTRSYDELRTAILKAEGK